MSVARPDTWMPMYWGDYARDTAHLSTEEHGAYLLLISHYWSTGKPLPDNDAQLARIARCDSRPQWKRLRAVLKDFFKVEEGVWRHKRIDEELAIAFENLEKYAEASKKAVDAKRRKRSANGSGNDPSDDPSPEPTTDPPNDPSFTPPPPSTVQEGSPTTTSESRTVVGSSWRALIGIFDEARVDVWGEQNRRPWPDPTDQVHAQRLLDRGLTLEQAGWWFRAEQAKRKAANDRPIDKLGYFRHHDFKALIHDARPHRRASERERRDAWLAALAAAGPERAH